MRAKRTDQNQAGLIRDLRTAGFSVADTSSVGKGFPDLVIARNGRTLLVEVKTKKGQLRQSQRDFIAGWSAGVIVAKTVWDVINEWEDF